MPLADGSVVAALDLRTPSYREQRKNPRFDVDLGATVTVDGEAHVARISNLSLGGALIAVPSAVGLGVGARVEVSFRVPELDTPLSAGAEVRWVSRGEDATTGVQFVTGFRARQTWALGRFFERLRLASP